MTAAPARRRLTVRTITAKPTCPHEPSCPAADAPDHDAAVPVARDWLLGITILCNHVVLYADTGETLADGRAVAPHRPDVPHRTNPDHGHTCPCENEEN